MFAQEEERVEGRRTNWKPAVRKLFNVAFYAFR